MSTFKWQRLGEPQLTHKKYAWAISNSKRKNRNSYSIKCLSAQTLEQRIALSGNDVVDFLGRYEFESDLTSTSSLPEAVAVAGQVHYSQSRMGLGQALELDNSTGVVDISATAVSVSEEFTISLWVQVPEQGGKDSLVAINDNQGNALMVLYLDTDRSLKVKVGQNSALTNVAEKLGSNEWYHVSIVREAVEVNNTSTAKIFLDGELARTFNLGGTDFSNAHWTIGAERGSSGYLDQLTGKVDDVRLYDRALADLEVNTVYWQGIKRGEYAYASSRVPVNAASHHTVSSGAWNDPSIWSNGNVPSTGADVVIHQNHNITYSGLSEERLRTIRVDGLLEFDQNSSSRLLVDYFYVSRTGKLIAGTLQDPIDSASTVEIVFAAVDASNPDIDTSWDPMQISRGLVVAGEISIHGAEKTGYAVLDGDHLAGTNRLKFAEVPADWQAGDSLVVAGTAYNPNGSNVDNSAFRDEVVTITSIDRNLGYVYFLHQDVFGQNSLRFDHTTPDRVDANGNPLQIYVANMTRNVSFQTEGWESGQVPIEHRGHTMFQHNRTVDVHNAGFYGLGRTDKTKEVNDPVVANGTLQPGSGTNRRGRYAIHFHRNGADQLDDVSAPVIEGNAIWGSPGWGLVVHDSRAIVEDNVSFDVVGAHYVTEDGNEIAEFRNNLAIKATGGRSASMHEGEENHDRAFDGHGFWFESGFSARVAEGNVVASAASAGFFVWGRLDRTEFLVDIPIGHLPEDLRTIVPEGSDDYDSIKAWKVPLRNFSDNVVANSRGAMALAGHLRDDTGTDIFGLGHDEWGYVDRLTGWNLHGYGIGVNYASHAMIRESVFLGDLENPVPLGNRALFDVVDGIGFYQMKNSRYIYSIDSQYEGFHTGAIVSQTGGQSLFEDDEKDVGAPRIEGGRFANNTVNLDASDGRTGNLPSDTLYTDNSPFTPWAEFAGDIDFVIRPDNQAPVASYVAEPIGGLAVRFNARASYDPDYYLVWDEGDSNTIASFAWDFNNDGITDDWGRDISYVFDAPGNHTVTLTVYDSDGATDVHQQTINVQSSEFQNVFAPGDGDFSDPFDNESLFSPSASLYGPGWFFNEWEVDTNNEQLVRSKFAYQSYAHYIVPNRRVHQGELSFSYRFKNDEGDTTPNEFSALVYGINGTSFSTSEWTGLSSNSFSNPAEITTLYDSGNLGGESIDWNTVESTIDFGTGYDYFVVELVVDRDVNPSLGDFIAFDDFTLGLSEAQTSNKPTINIQATDPIADESGQGAQVTATTDRVLLQPLRIQYSYTGTADPNDYNPELTGELVLPAGEPSVTLDLNAIDDDLVEQNETLVIDLLDAAGYDLGTEVTAAITIQSNDGELPSVEVVALTDTVYEAGENAQLRFSRDASEESLTVSYSLSGTASQLDYEPELLGEITFAPGEYEKIIEITAFDDSQIEGNETLILSLDQSNDYQIGDNSNATVMIVSNDLELGPNSVLIDFEDIGNQSGSGELSESISIDGYVFSDQGPGEERNLMLFGPDDGYDSYQIRSKDWARSIVVEREDGQAFDFESLDYGAISDGSWGQFDAMVTGVTADGSIYETSIYSNTVSLETLAAGWQDLVQLTIDFAGLEAGNAYGFVDNLIFSQSDSSQALEVNSVAALASVNLDIGVSLIETDIAAEIETPETDRQQITDNALTEEQSSLETSESIHLDSSLESSADTVINFHEWNEYSDSLVSDAIEIDNFQFADESEGTSRALHLAETDLNTGLRSSEYGRTISISEKDGEVFDLISLDYSAISDFSWHAFDAKITGEKTDGTVYSTYIESESNEVATELLEWTDLNKVYIDFGEGSNQVYGLIENVHLRNAAERPNYEEAIDQALASM